MKKRTFAIILALILAVGVIPQGVMAAELAGEGYEAGLEALEEGNLLPAAAEAEEGSIGTEEEDELFDPADLDVPEDTGEAAAGASFNPYVFSEDGESASVQVQPALMTIEAEEDEDAFVEDEEVSIRDEEEQMIIPATEGIMTEHVLLNNITVTVEGVILPKDDKSGEIAAVVGFGVPDAKYTDLTVNVSTCHFINNSSVKASVDSITLDTEPWNGVGEQAPYQFAIINNTAYAQLRIPLINDATFLNSYNNITNMVSGACIGDDVSVAVYGSADVSDHSPADPIDMPVVFKVELINEGTTFKQNGETEQLTFHAPVLENAYYEPGSEGSPDKVISILSGTDAGAFEYELFVFSPEQQGNAVPVDINGTIYYRRGIMTGTPRDVIALSGDQQKLVLPMDYSESGAPPQAGEILYVAVQTKHSLTAGGKSYSSDYSNLVPVIAVDPTDEQLASFMPVNLTVINSTMDSTAVSLDVGWNRQLAVDTYSLDGYVLVDGVKVPLKNSIFGLKLEPEGSGVPEDMTYSVINATNVKRITLPILQEGDSQFVMENEKPAQALSLKNGDTVVLELFAAVGPGHKWTNSINETYVVGKGSSPVAPEIYGAQIDRSDTYGQFVNNTVQFSKTDKNASEIEVFVLSEKETGMGSYTIDGKTYFMRGLAIVEPAKLINRTTFYGGRIQEANVQLKTFPENKPLEKGEALYYAARSLYGNNQVSELSAPVKVVVPCDPPVLESVTYDQASTNATAVFKTEDVNADWYELYAYTKKNTGGANITVGGVTYYDYGIMSFSPGMNSTAEAVKVDKKTGTVTLWTSYVYYGSYEKPANGETVYFAVETPAGGISNLIEYVVGKGPVSQTVSLLNATVTLNPKSYTYTAAAIKPKPVVKYNGKTLKEGTDYTLAYKNNVNVGTAGITITGKGKYIDSVAQNFTITKAKYTITAKNVKKTQNKKKKTYSLGVKTIGGKLTYKSSNKKIKVSSKGKITVPAKFVGEATITITSKATANCLKCTKKIKVTVNPPKTSISSVKNTGKSTATAKWKKTAFTSNSGYQIQYTTDKNMKKGLKTVTVPNQKTVSRIFRNLKKGKTYYFRIRSFQKVGKKTYCSAWSAKKSVKIKK